MDAADNERDLIVGLFVLLICLGVAGYHFVNRPSAEKPAVVTQEQTQDVAALRQQLDISKANAEALKKQLAEVQAERRTPVATYYVEAPDVDRAAQVVERQIAEDRPSLPMAAREKSDRTVVTPIKTDKDGKRAPPEQQKVDVYKINLRKDHRVKAGASVVDGKVLMSIGYEQGKFEALAHFEGGHYKGATVTYNIIEW